MKSIFRNTNTMSKKSFFCLVLMSAATLFFQGNRFGTPPAFAVSAKARCGNDPGYPDQAKRRVAWALKCGYIEQEDATFFNRKGQYPTFEIPGRSMYLFFEADGPCYSNVTYVGTCLAVGCFSENTELLFPGGYKTLKEAHSEQQETIMSMDGPQDFERLLAFSPEPIEFYLHGETKETLLKISTTTKSIEVTTNHPMVLANGTVVAADELKSGESWLATIDGPERIISLFPVPYSGEVWNVQVVSLKPSANIHVANGFITGGYRYQNDWTDDNLRSSEILNQNINHRVIN